MRRRSSLSSVLAVGLSVGLALSGVASWVLPADAQIKIERAAASAALTWPLTAPTGATSVIRSSTGATDGWSLALYDSDGTAYVNVLTGVNGNTVSMTGLFGAGSAAAPSVAVGSTNTGMYGGSETVYFTAGGVYRGQFGSNGMMLAATLPMGWVDGKVFLESAAVIQLGVDVNGAAVAQTLKAHDGITGTDIAGANLTLAAGRGTGAGAPGTLIFKTATALSTGTTAQTLATRLTIDGAGLATYTGNITLTGASPTITATANDVLSINASHSGGLVFIKTNNTSRLIVEGTRITAGSSGGTGALPLYASAFYVGTTAGADCTSAAAVTVVKGIVTVCSEPQPEMTPVALYTRILSLESQLAALQAAQRQ